MTARQLARVHRVRQVQVRLSEADEAQARDKATSEQRLRDRVRELADQIAPGAGTDSAATLSALAHFRERLHQSAATADTRLNAALLQHARAAERVTEARRDRTCAEKLRDRAAATAAARRSNDEYPASRRNRHDPC